jgi:hypothetical protein
MEAVHFGYSDKRSSLQLGAGFGIVSQSAGFTPNSAA